MLVTPGQEGHALVLDRNHAASVYHRLGKHGL
jgi:hypothetical protein